MVSTEVTNIFFLWEKCCDIYLSINRRKPTNLLTMQDFFEGGFHVLIKKTCSHQLAFHLLEVKVVYLKITKTIH